MFQATALPLHQETPGLCLRCSLCQECSSHLPPICPANAHSAFRSYPECLHLQEAFLDGPEVGIPPVCSLRTLHLPPLPHVLLDVLPPHYLSLYPARLQLLKHKDADCAYIPTS